MRWALMDRYLAGECSSIELAEVERWLAEAPKRREFMKQLSGPSEIELSEARASIWARLEDELGPRQGLPGGP